MVYDTHTASLSFGGGREDCHCFDCRKERLDTLSKVSLIFCNRVYIHNYFYFYTNLDVDAYKKYPEDAAYIKQLLLEDISLLMHVKPLIKSGIIKILSPGEHFCPHCHRYSAKDNRSSRILSNAYKVANKLFFDTANIELIAESGSYCVSFEGRDKFNDFAASIDLDNVPKEILSSPGLLKRLSKNGRLKLSKSVAQRIDVTRDIPHMLARNIALPFCTSELLNSKFLTNMSAHIDYLNIITGNADVVKNNVIAGRHMSAMIPFFDELDINTLLKVRNREEESFILFKNAIDTAIKEYKNTQRTFDESIAKEIFEEVINPSLARLNMRQKQAKRDLVKKISLNTCAAGIIGALSFGVYHGLYQAEILKYAGILGFATLPQNIISNSILSGGNSDMRNENMYYLWKSYRKSRR